MRKPVVWLIIASVLAGAFFFFRFSTKNPGTSGLPGTTAQSIATLLDSSPDMCQVFPLKEVNDLTGKSFQRTETYKSGDGKTHNCQYYIDNHFVTLDLGFFEVAGQRKGLEYLDRKITTDPRITMEHFMVYSGKNPDQIMDIYLVMGPSKFVRVGKSSATVISNDEFVAFAQNIALILQGKKAYMVPGAAEPSPTVATPTGGVPLPTAQSTARSFLELINEKRIDSAVAMMTPELRGDESMVQAWGVQFNSFEQFLVMSTEDSMKESWTEDTQ